MAGESERPSVPTDEVESAARERPYAVQSDRRSREDWTASFCTEPSVFALKACARLFAIPAILDRLALTPSSRQVKLEKAVAAR